MAQQLLSQLWLSLSLRPGSVSKRQALFYLRAESLRLSALRPALLLLREPWKEVIDIQKALALHCPRLKALDCLGSGFLDADDFLPGLLLKEKEARVGEQIGTATEQRGQQRQPLPLTHCAGIYLGAEMRSLRDVELARALPL